MPTGSMEASIEEESVQTFIYLRETVPVDIPISLNKIEVSTRSAIFGLVETI